MTSELKEWIRILKFGLPNVVAWGFVLGGIALMVREYSVVVGLKGTCFSLIGLMLFSMVGEFRANKELKELKKCTNDKQNDLP